MLDGGRVYGQSGGGCQSCGPGVGLRWERDMAPSGEGIFGRILRLVGFGSGVEQQFGAVPYRRGAGGLEFLVITSRRTGRWIFPKGGKMPFLSAADTAAEEAYEEAGVRGSDCGVSSERHRQGRLLLGELPQRRRLLPQARADRAHGGRRQVRGPQ